MRQTLKRVRRWYFGLPIRKSSEPLAGSFYHTAVYNRAAVVHIVALLGSWVSFSYNHLMLALVLAIIMIIAFVVGLLDMSSASGRKKLKLVNATKGQLIAVYVLLALAVLAFMIEHVL